MKQPMTRLQMMQAASIIQNPHVVPQKPDPTLVGRRDILQRGIAGLIVPGTAQENEGMSRGVMAAKRADAQGVSSDAVR